MDFSTVGEFEEMFIEDGELNKAKMRGAFLKYVRFFTEENSDYPYYIRLYDNEDIVDKCYDEFVRWFNRKVEGMYKYEKRSDFDTDTVKELYFDFIMENDELYEFLNDAIDLDDDGDFDIRRRVSSHTHQDGDVNSHQYPELHDKGLVDDLNDPVGSKMLGSIKVFAKDVEAIESPSKEVNQRDIIAAWNKWMMDKFGNEWVMFISDNLDPGQVKEYVNIVSTRDSSFNELIEGKWEYSPDELEGNSDEGVPDSIGGWSDYDVGSDDDNPDDDQPDDTGTDDKDSGGDKPSGDVCRDKSIDLEELGIDDGIENTVVHGDSTEVIKAVGREYGKVFDAVITDVPYGQAFDPRSTDEEGIQGDSSVPEAMKINREVFKSLRLSVKKGSPVLSFAGDSCLCEMKTLLEEWYTFKQIIIWNKMHIGMSSMGDTPVRWRPKHEYALLSYHGDPRVENENRHDGTVMEFKRPSNEKRFHPTEKPPDMMRYIIESLTEEGDLIVDPFAGSGVTLDAAKQTGRKYFGVEIDDRFYSKIQERLKQMTLF